MSAFDSLPFGTVCVPPSLALLSLCFCLFSSSLSQSVSSDLSSSHFAPLSRPPPSLSSPKLSLLSPSGDAQCVARPSECSLNCPRGYEGKFESNGQLRCLCQCRPPIQTTNCQAYGLLLCRSDERCTTQNGQITCVPEKTSNSVFGPSVRPQKPHMVLPVNVVPLRPSLPIRPLEKHWPSATNDRQNAKTAAGQMEKQTEGDSERENNDPCEGITCDESPLHMCQLVESDCDSKTTEQQKTKTCPPVAKCLINPCPHGTPMRLPDNGVTALCRTDGQCLDGWCHKIGYNGLGFCCPLPIPSLIKNGQCEAKQTKKRMMAWEPKTNCTAECRSDSDCISSVAKCCFDGCGMICQLLGEADITKGRSEEIEQLSVGREMGKMGETTGEMGETTGAMEKARHRMGETTEEMSETTRQMGEIKDKMRETTWEMGEIKDKMGETTRKSVRPPHEKVAECPSLRNRPIKCEDTAPNECLEDTNCAEETKCCSDGCSLRCIRISPNISNFGPNEWHKKSEISKTEHFPRDKRVRHLANCPFRLLNFSSTDCASNCASDADCARRSPLLRCCPVGCGMQCQFGDKLTPCVHLLATNLNEVDKLVEVPKSIGRPTVQCTEQGQFEKVQFDPVNGQFWCVDPSTGVESVGSRVSASPLAPVSPPDCNVRHLCKFNCSTTFSNVCPHGLRLDHRGCPLDELCQCRNPCEDFKCSFPEKEICVLKVVECVDDSFCPPIPTCVENVCRRFGSQSVGDFVCSSASDCQMHLANSANGQSVQCQFAFSNSPIGRIGICCASPSVHLFKEQSIDGEGEISKGKAKNERMGSGESKSKQRTKLKQGLCPTEADGGTGEEIASQSEKTDCSDLCSDDSDCVGIRKCCAKKAGGCRHCVQPILTTNCLNLLSAVLSLDATQIEHSVPKPNCDPKTGAFSRVQCDRLGWCWCVRSALSAFPLLGTRLFQPTDGELFCETPKVCSLRKCSASVCPFGVEFDSDGCPLSSECRCHNPCDQIQCPIGQICLLRERDCVESEQIPTDFVGTNCLPVPICEPSPCGGVLKPLLNAAFLMPQKCQLNADSRLSPLPQCPADFQCIRQREYYPTEMTHVGICCPREENDGDSAVENAVGKQQISENGKEKAIFCHLPLHQGNGMDKCGESHSEMRYFYNSHTDKCEAFLFAGCGGNANNFKRENECEKKCKGMENIEIGFVTDANGQFRTMERSLRDYLRRVFDLTEGQIRKVRVDWPTKGKVRFTVTAPDARQKAKRISETLELGHFQFPLDDGTLVKAQTEGWWTKRKTADAEDEEGKGEEDEGQATDKAAVIETEQMPLFWVLFFSVAIFAFVVLLIPCCAFLCLRSRRRDGFGRDSFAQGRNSFCSPSPQIRALTQHNWSSAAVNRRNDGISTTPTVLMEDAEERVHSLRMRTTAFDDGMPSQSMREDHLPIPSSAVPSSPSPAASSNISIHFANRPQQRIIAPRILTEEEREEEEIRRGERTSTRTTWRWRI